jgi:hypothetical protein
MTKSALLVCAPKPLWDSAKYPPTARKFGDDRHSSNRGVLFEHKNAESGPGQVAGQVRPLCPAPMTIAS